ncbi:hypothetical protein GQ53DRAFT_110721 [Thozetella sp. PMI_491]|nr:hypothetical protein GQ53DRAFT_110721 [Thozetella sp. PMI_491]
MPTRRVIRTNCWPPPRPALFCFSNGSAGAQRLFGPGVYWRILHWKQAAAALGLVPLASLTATATKYACPQRGGLRNPARRGFTHRGYDARAEPSTNAFKCLQLGCKPTRTCTSLRLGGLLLAHHIAGVLQPGQPSFEWRLSWVSVPVPLG